MKLYYSPMSPNCRKVLSLINFIGAKVALEVVDVMAGETEKPNFIKMNPNCRVPVLEDGNFHLWESNAIMQYIAEKSGAHEVWPKELQGRADICRWQNWESCHWGQAVGEICFERVFKPFRGETADTAVVNEWMDEYHDLARILNGHLEGRKFICGDKPTLADFSLACAATYAEAAQIPFGNYHHIQEWFGRMEKLDAMKKTVPPRM